MTEIVIPGLYLLSGICAYAAVNHLSICSQRPVNRVHLLFGILCLLMILFALTHVTGYRAMRVEDYIPALKWGLAYVALFFMLFPWFIAEYTGVRPLPLLITFNIVLAVLFVANLMLPYSLQYQEMHGLTRMHLPWGEALTLPLGSNGAWFVLASVAVLSAFGFAFYALGALYRRGRKNTSLIMILAIALFMASAAEGILVRASVINFIPLGVFGYLAMIIVMSLVLSYEARQSGARLQSVLDFIPAVVYLKDPAGRYLMINRHYEDQFHISNAAIYGKTDSDFFPKAQADVMRVNDQRVLATRHALEEEEVADRDGKPRVYLSIKFPLFHSDNTPYAVCGISTDITNRKRTETVIRDIAAGVSDETGIQFFHQIVQSLAKVFDADYAFIAVLDEHNKEQVNTLAVCAHGQIVDNISYSLRDTPCSNVMGQHTCAYPRDVQLLFPKDHLLTEMGVSGYIGAPLFDSKGEALGILVVLDSKPLQDIDNTKDILEIFAARAGAEMERNRANAQIRRMAYQDYLTGLASRALCHEQLAETLGRVRQSGQIGAILMLDLDHFKTINNALSHDVGDEVLKMIARRLLELAGEQNFVARLGGDDFVMLSKTGFANGAEAEKYTRELAERTMKALANPLIMGERILSVGASIGAVLFPSNGENELDILRHAEMALYQAKNLGRNNIQFYLPSLQAVAESRLKLEDGLRGAIDDNELELYFQPQLNAGGQIIGAEVLLRWHHPEMGDIPPSTFIPVAEDTGLIHEIGKWVFDQAGVKLSAWLKADVPFSGHLSINVCAWQFARPDFVQLVHETMSAHKISAERLMLEVTESALLYNIDETIAKLEALRSLGLKISLDDFGTGYSSLTYLKVLPLDELKIDISFIRELDETQEHPLVETIIAIGRHMKLDVIAEGVENKIQRDILKKLGCENYQGYFFSKPLPEKEFLEWLRSDKTSG